MREEKNGRTFKMQQETYLSNDSLDLLIYSFLNTLLYLYLFATSSIIFTPTWIKWDLNIYEQGRQINCY